MAHGSQAVSPQKETRLVSAKGEDVSKWRKYAATYYKRSLKSASAETRGNNRNTYLHYRELLEAAGYGVEEKPSEIRLIISEPKATE